MNFTVDQIIPAAGKPFIYVDYNELLDYNLIMLCQRDTKQDFFGRPVELCEGLEVVGYQEDEDSSGARDDIIVEGYCTKNCTGFYPHVKWLIKINQKGIRYASDILLNGW